MRVSAGAPPESACGPSERLRDPSKTRHLDRARVARSVRGDPPRRGDPPELRV